MSTYAERVAKGAVLLDTVKPGWASEIDVDTLDIRSGYGCILGQLYGSWHTGLKALFHSSEVGWELAPEHGLNLTEDEWDDDDLKYDAAVALEGHWAAEIALRLV